MQDPIRPQEPFQPEGTRSSGPGCSRVALFGCGGLMVLLLVGVVVLLLNLERLTVWGFGLMEKQVMARLPADVSEEDTERIRAGFAAVVEAIRDESVDPEALNRLQPLMLRFSDTGRRPTQEDVDELIEVLEQAAGLAPIDGSRRRRGPSPPLDPICSPA